MRFLSKARVSFLYQKINGCSGCSGFSKKKSTILPTKYSAFYMEITGIEPVTSCMPCKRSPS